MENNNWLYIPIIILGVWFWRDHKSLSNKLEISRNMHAYCENELEDTQSNLEQANSNIEEAQYYAWESYEEMGEALDNLQTVN